MKIINANLLKEFRKAHHKCEWCGKPGPIEVHHWQAKGQGSGKRVDWLCNLYALGYAFGCNHHGQYHSGEMARKARLTQKGLDDLMLEYIAKREKTTADWIRSELTRINRLDKNAPRCQCGYPLDGLDCPECERKHNAKIKP